MAKNDRRIRSYLILLLPFFLVVTHSVALVSLRSPQSIELKTPIYGLGVGNYKGDFFVYWGRSRSFGVSIFPMNLDSDVPASRLFFGGWFPKFDHDRDWGLRTIYIPSWNLMFLALLIPLYRVVFARREMPKRIDRYEDSPEETQE